MVGDTRLTFISELPLFFFSSQVRGQAIVSLIFQNTKKEKIICFTKGWYRARCWSRGIGSTEKHKLLALESEHQQILEFSILFV